MYSWEVGSVKCEVFYHLVFEWLHVRSSRKVLAYLRGIYIVANESHSGEADHLYSAYLTTNPGFSRPGCILANHMPG